jgi:hypothetical protein
LDECLIPQVKQGNQMPVEPCAAADSDLGKRRAVFLSHSSEDKKMAQEFCASLEARGFPCWIAPRDIPEGRSYAAGIIEGIKESQSLLLLASEKALASVQVLSEVEQAHKRALPIYTVLIPPAKVRGEMDFYLSRLHWMESGGRTAEQIAAKLAAVLSRDRGWEDVASPPTLGRTLRYRPSAFGRLAAAAALGMALVLGGGIYALNMLLDLDFRRLGYVDVATESSEDGPAALGHLQVWAMARGVRFADMHLMTVIETADGRTRQRTFSEWPSPEQVGSMEAIEIPMGTQARRLTTCLIVPNTSLKAPYRVTQSFVLTTQGQQTRVAETAEKLVSKDDASPCGARP